MAYDQVPVIRLKHLSKEQKRAYVLAHNKITLNTGFDMDLLKQELTDTMDIDMSQFGLSVNLIASLLKGIDDDPTEEDIEEQYPIALGILYQLGNHRLICGDATNPDHLERFLDGVETGLYLIDSPYNVSYQGKTS